MKQIILSEKNVDRLIRGLDTIQIARGDDDKESYMIGYLKSALVDAERVILEIDERIYDEHTSLNREI